jgi:hypothetical protein
MWIESVLAKELDRVAAPKDLWDRTLAKARGSETSPSPRPRFSGEKLTWALVAAMLVIVLVWGVPSRRDLVIRSANATQIREWVKANSGLDVPLLADSSSIRLTSARMSRDGVEIACRVGRHDAKLLISKNKSSVQHAALNANSSTISWGMNSRLYTLACATPEDLRIACLLCHSSSERRMALN